jgi:hypothetical protein
VKKIGLLAIALFCLGNIYSQSADCKVKSDFIIGAWSDTIHSKTGDGFIFAPDSCLSFIINGEPTECIIEKQNLRVRFRINYNVNPRQLDILLIDLKKDSIKGIIPMIFDIIDDNHIKLVSFKTKSDKRPIDFNQREDVEIAILTRYVEKQK